jgi:hypothetical protein
MTARTTDKTTTKMDNNGTFFQHLALTVNMSTSQANYAS